jgi:drug/metabolite transporter (DMT)-like permease
MAGNGTGEKRTAVLCVFLASVAFSTGGLFIKLIPWSALAINGARNLLGALVIGIYMLIRRHRIVFSRQVLLGALSLIGVTTLFAVSNKLTTAANAIVLQFTAPVFVIIFGAILFHEKITPVRVICMAAVLAGCVLLSGVIESGGLMWSVFGLAMGVGTSICNAVATMATNEASDVRKIHPLTVQFYAAVFALIPMLPFADYGVVGSFIAESPAAHIPYLIVYALIAALLPNLFFNIAFKFLDSSIVSILASGAEPTSALIFGLLVYQEVPTVFGLVGMVLVVGAIIILTRVVSAGK